MAASQHGREMATAQMEKRGIEVEKLLKELLEEVLPKLEIPSIPTRRPG
jgi:hypothetical protein